MWPGIRPRGENVLPRRSQERRGRSPSRPVNHRDREGELSRPKRKLRAGVIGTGMGRYHMEGFATHPRAELLAVCDLNVQEAKTFASKYGAKYVFRDYRDMVAMEELDMVAVATPNYLHARMTIAALRAGKHVLCEKPMATRLTDAKAMVREAGRAKRRLMVNMSYRFDRRQQELKRRIEQGELGHIYYAKSHYTRRHGTPLGESDWFVSKKKAGGGPIVDLGVHAFDLVWWLMGSPRPSWVLGATYSELLPRRLAKGGVKGDVDDLAAAMVRFDTGPMIFFEASWEGHQQGHEGYEIFGTKGGAACWDWESDLKMMLYFDDKKGKPVDRPVRPPRKKVSAYWHFVDACLDRRIKMLASGEECLAVARVLDATQRSQKTGKAIRLPRHPS
jgi:predicted dehydrogenase